MSIHWAYSSTHHFLITSFTTIKYQHSYKYRYTHAQHSFFVFFSSLLYCVLLSQQQQNTQSVEWKVKEIYNKFSVQYICRDREKQQINTYRTFSTFCKVKSQTNSLHIIFFNLLNQLFFLCFSEDVYWCCLAYYFCVIKP